jgi:hypothetical protein
LYSAWKGEGAMPYQDDKVIRAAINAVHAAGKRIRFWGAPDTPVCWQKLMDMHADIINTDKIDDLVDAMAKRP